MTVDCEQAANLISSRIDGELAASDEARLEAHLAGCAACRAALEAAELQDAAMVRAFAGERHAAAALATRVTQEMSAFAPAPRPEAKRAWRGAMIRWARWTSAAAAGFVAALIFMRPAAPPETRSQAPVLPEKPIAHLALALGDVFTCPSHDEPWQPMAEGDGLAPGAKVRTAREAKCELALADGSRLRLNSGTELHFTAAGDVQLARGQIWSAVPPDAGPLRIAAGEAEVTTGGPAAQFEVACEAKAATVTVVAGSARVHGQGQATTVRGGESLHLGEATAIGAEPPLVAACTPVADPVKATRWLDDLLVLLPPDDPELLARVDALLARIVAERSGRAVASSPGDVERDVRARGHAWAAPIARFALDHLSAPADADLNKRRTAARLLADLASPSSVPDLIALLGDDDGEVRFHAAAALHRLTGQTLGFPPDYCAATPRDAAPMAAWQEWWARNGSRYPAAPQTRPNKKPPEAAEGFRGR